MLNNHFVNLNMLIHSLFDLFSPIVMYFYAVCS